MKLLFFLNAFLSVTDYGSDGFQHEINCDRGTSGCRDSGLYKVMLKPYVLQILNSKAMGALKKTNCFYNLHYLFTNPNLHYLAKLPIMRALISKRIPQFQEWILNLRKGPSAAKGKFIILYMRTKSKDCQKANENYLFDFRIYLRLKLMNLLKE